MDTKSKNKNIKGILLLIGIYMFTFSLFTISHELRYTEYIINSSYFESSEFRNQLYNYADNVKTLYTDFKDYPEDINKVKASKEEIENLKENYKNKLQMKEDEINNKYSGEIGYSRDNNEKEKLNIFLKERREKLDDAKKKYTKSEDELKKEIIENKNKRYKEIKSNIDSKPDMQYYIKNMKNNKTYTNIKKLSNIQQYISEQALYSIKYPEELGYSYEDNQIEGYFIVPREVEGYSMIHTNYDTFKLTKNRLINQGIVSLICFFTGIFMIMYVLKNKEDDNSTIDKISRVYEKIPLDLRAFIFIVCTYVPIGFGVKCDNLLSRNIIEIIIISSISVASIFYFIININSIVNFKKNKGNFNKENFKIQLKKTLLYKVKDKSFDLIDLLKDFFIIKSIMFKVSVIIIATFMLPVMILINDNLLNFVGAWGIIIYLIFIPQFVIKKVGYLNKIIKGTEDIISNDLQYVIEENGKGQLAKLAHNINNIKDGYKNAVENELKSERLKTELITNVSHDLKTPLTSIINYINILKMEDVSKEEMDSYIEILDRKSQRLKVLIEDLFEATKMSSGAVELKIEKVDVVSLLKQALAEFDKKIEKSSLIFRVKTDKQNIYAELDGKKTWRLFENLINNILKYSQKNTRVYIDVKEEDNNVVIIMKNISAYEMNFSPEEIFERFKRGDESRSTEGSGLGLAIAKNIAKVQGGKMDIEIDGDLFKVVVKFKLNDKII